MLRRLLLALLAAAAPVSAQSTAKRPLRADDIYRLRAVNDPQISPDGAWVAYTVTTADSAKDKNDTDVWMTSWDGTQSIRLVFHSPQSLRRIRLRFDEADAERTQEFTLRWSPDGGRTFREVVRQQYTFSPAGSTSEVEDLNVDLVAVTALELTIIPDQRGGSYASLAEWRLA